MGSSPGVPRDFRLSLPSRSAASASAAARAGLASPVVPGDVWLSRGSRCASAAAMMLLRASVAWHVYDLSQSAFHLGLIGLLQSLPVPTLMLVGGAVADTYERRKVMMAAQAVAMACAMMLFAA